MSKAATRRRRCSHAWPALRLECLATGFGCFRLISEIDMVRVSAINAGGQRRDALPPLHPNSAVESVPMGGPHGIRAITDSEHGIVHVAAPRGPSLQACPYGVRHLGCQGLPIRGPGKPSIAGKNAAAANAGGRKLAPDDEAPRLAPKPRSCASFVPALAPRGRWPLGDRGWRCWRSLASSTASMACRPCAAWISR